MAGRFDALFNLKNTPHPSIPPMAGEKSTGGKDPTTPIVTDSPANQQTSEPEKVQTSKPANQQGSSDARKQISLPVNLQTDKPANQQISLPANKQGSKLLKKFSSYLTEDSLKGLKRVAFETDRKDYEVLQEAVDTFLARLK